MNNQKIKNIELVNKKLTCDEIHWWQFPLNDFSVKFSDNYKDGIFDKIYTERSKSLEFSSYINKKSEKYNKNWSFKRQRALLWNYKINAEFVPAWFVYESAKYLKLDLFEIENNIKSYMTFRGRTIIENPKLPVKVTPAFSSILVHMMCDGTIRKRMFFYFQKDENGIKRFENILKSVFGEYKSKYKRGYYAPLIFLSVISNYYNIYSFTSFNSDIPKKLTQQSRLHKVAALAAALFDDGSAMSSVRFYSASEKFIFNLKKLIESLDYNCNQILTRKCNYRENYKIYTVNISASSLNSFYNDLKILFEKFPLLHIGKKFLEIEKLVNIQNRGWNQRNKLETKNIILNTLKDDEKTAFELRDTTNVSLWTVYHHLQQLIKKEKVSKYKKFKRKFAYKLV